MDWGTAVVAVATLVVGLAGGYLGARWQARYDRVQWRREKLLQLSSDLLSASTEMVQIGLKRTKDNSVPRPIAVANRLLYAAAGIALVSPELQSVAEACEETATAVFDEGDSKREEAYEVANSALGHFVTEARKVLLDLHPDLDPPKPKDRAWARLPWRRSGRNVKQDHPASPKPVSDSTGAAEQPSDHGDSPGGTSQRQ